MGKYAGLDDALAEVGERLDHVRQTLYYCDVDFLRASRRTLRHDMQASAYVLIAACVERFINAVLGGLISEINSRNVPIKDIRLGLLSVAHHRDFLSLQDLRGLKMWSRRATFLKAIDETEPCILLTENLPLDGRTIRPIHLESIWEVFDLPLTPFPSPRCRLALTDLADNRNLVAHGDAATSTVAGGKSITSVLRQIDQIEETILHVFECFEIYLNDHGYKR